MQRARTSSRTSRSLAAACRAAGVPVIHVWYIVEPGAPGPQAERAALRGGQGRQRARPRELGRRPGRRARAAGRRSRRREDADERLLRHEARHPAARARSRDADHHRRLDEHVDRAHAPGMRPTPATAPIVASDGTSTVNDEWQHAALNYAMQNVASVATCAEISAALDLTRVRRLSAGEHDRRSAAPRAPVRLGGDVRRRESRHRRDGRGGPAHGRSRDAACTARPPRKHCPRGVRDSRRTARGSCAGGPI